jgi:hypothetical protein
VSALRKWCQLNTDDVEERYETEARIASELEWWLSGALSRNPVKWNQGWWSDGVVHLVLRRADGLTIVAAGVTIWADADARREFIAPFEAEFYFKSELSHRFKRTIVRFGIREGVNGIYRLPYGSATAYQRVFDERPQRDQDWAVAIEITEE